MKVLWILSTLLLITFIGQVFSDLIIDSKGRVSYAIRVSEPEEQREAKRQEMMAPKEWEVISGQQILNEQKPLEGEKRRVPQVEPRTEPMESEATYVRGIQQTPRVGEGQPQKNSEPRKLYFYDEDGTIRVWDPTHNRYHIIN